MVGPLMILKMLHCKRLKIGQMRKLCRKKNSQNTTEFNTLQKTKTEIKCEENYVRNTKKVCRICLKEGAIPIYGGLSLENFSENIILFGGINLHTADDYPKYLCYSCEALLQGAILFRRSAQESDRVLKESQYVKEKNDNITKDTYPVYENDVEYKIIDPTEEDASCTSENEKVEIKKYTCRKCVLNFDTLKEYENHRLSDDHENLKKQCPICKKLYTIMYYKRHVALHNLEPCYMCDICGKKFVIQGHFSRHRLTHFYNLPYKCPECPYRGRFSESLKMHMRSHTGEKPYQCTQCPSRFINKSNLNKHMLTHKGEYDFKCETCGRGFYKKRDLELHFKVDHTGIKDHVCNVCGKEFGYRKQMMKHQLKVHKRQKLRSGRLPLYLQLEMQKDQGKKL